MKTMCALLDGEDLYHLTATARNCRRWHLKNDPVHEWMLHQES